MGSRPVGRGIGESGPYALRVDPAAAPAQRTLPGGARRRPGGVSTDMPEKKGRDSMAPGSEDIVRLLPYLRRYARALTGSQERGDRFVRLFLEVILQEPNR